MSTPPLTALRTFEAVARLGSFRAAAEALCVTQSAVSHQVRNLEDWLGKPLFEREGNRTRLLPHGLDLANSLSASFKDIEAACQRLRNSLRAHAGNRRALAPCLRNRIYSSADTATANCIHTYANMRRLTP